MKRRMISILVILVLWQMASLSIGKEVILPSIPQVIMAMITLFKTKTIFVSIFATLKRMFIGLLLSSIGIPLGIIAGKSEVFDDYFSIVVSMLQTVPQIAFLLLFVIWFKSETSLIVMIMLMTFPLFYNNCKEAIRMVPDGLKNVSRLYPHNFIYHMFHIDMPLINDAIIAAYEANIPMTLKIAVMAEVIVSMNTGIGHSLYVARLNIDTATIFALVILMIVMMKIVLFIFHQLLLIINT